MFNPYLDKINNQISELERLKQNYQQMPQSPVNIYNNAIPTQNDFKAQILKENERVDEILVTSKTMFLDQINGKLYIKETNGEIKEFDVILPKDEKDLRIEELENKLKEMEEKYEQYYSANNEKCKSNEYVNGNDEPTTKATSTSISKQSK